MGKLNIKFIRWHIANWTLFASVAVCMIAFVFLAWRFGLVEVKNLVPAVLSSFFSTFLGATFAFNLNWMKDDRKEHETRRSALRSALFVLARQYNAMASISRLIEQYRMGQDRAINMPPYSPPDYSDLSQDFDALAFILDTVRMQTLMNLSIEQERFEQTIRVVEGRAKFHYDELQPAISLHKLNGKNISPVEAKEKLGDRIFGIAEHTATEVFFHLDATLASLHEVQEELFSLAKELYPNDKFLRSAKA